MVNTIEGKGSDCLFPQNVAYAFTELLTPLSQLLTCLTCTLPSILSFYLTSLGKIPLLLFYYTTYSTLSSLDLIPHIVSHSYMFY